MPTVRGGHPVARPRQEVPSYGAGGRVVVTALLLCWAPTGCAAIYSNVPDARARFVVAPTEGVAERSVNADIAVRRQGVIHVSAPCAYAVLADVAAWSKWDQSIVSTRWVSGHGMERGAVFEQVFDGFTAHSRVLLAEPGHVLRWRGRAPDDSGPVGVHTWTLFALGEDTTLVLNDEHFHAWYTRPVGWFTDLGISTQFDGTIRDLDLEAQKRCARPH
jgi:hypothetical protein